MADGIVQVAPDSTGKKIDTSEITVGANTVERQRIVIADDTSATGFAEVQAGIPSTVAAGLVTRSFVYPGELIGSAFPRTSADNASPIDTLTYNATSIGLSVMGTYGASSTVTATGTVDGTNFFNLPFVRNDNGLIEIGTSVALPANTARTWSLDCTGFVTVRIGTTVTSGTMNLGLSYGGFRGEALVSAVAQGVSAAGTAVLGNPVLMGGSDGTNAQTVKTATDGTLLINGVQDARQTGNLIAATTTVGPWSVNNRNVVTITANGTYAGVTFVIEATDNGTQWYGLQSINNATGVCASTWTPGTNATASYDAAVGGYTQVRVRATAWTSGSCVIGFNAQVFAYDPVVGAIAQGPAASGTASLGNPVLMGGSDATNTRSILLDTSGRQIAVGAAASAATIAGNPVLMGGTFTTTPPTITTGQAVNIQTTARGEQLVAISSGATAVAVKAASTAAVAADPTLAVSISPNLPAPTQSFVNSAATTNATSVKASAGTVYNITASNTGAAAAFVKFYNLAVAPTVGTSVPVFTMSIPASGTVTIAPALVGIRFGTGIALAITNLAADTDTTAVVAAQVKVATSYI